MCVLYIFVHLCNSLWLLFTCSCISAPVCFYMFWHLSKCSFSYVCVFLHVLCNNSARACFYIFFVSQVCFCFSCFLRFCRWVCFFACVFFFWALSGLKNFFFFHLKKPDREKSFFWLKTVDQQLFSLTGSVCFCVCRCVTGLWCMDRPSWRPLSRTQEKYLTLAKNLNILRLRWDDISFFF